MITLSRKNIIIWAVLCAGVWGFPYMLDLILPEALTIYIGIFQFSYLCILGMIMAAFGAYATFKHHSFIGLMLLTSGLAWTYFWGYPAYLNMQMIREYCREVALAGNMTPSADFAPTTGVQELATAADIKNSIDSAPIAIVKAYAPWCGHCKTMGPIFEQFAAEHPEFTAISVNIDNLDDQNALGTISGVPVTIVYKNGVEVGRIAGAKSAEAFTSAILGYIQ